MDERQRRIGENEALFRQVNERVKDLNRSFSIVLERGEYLCECGDESCTERVEVSLPDYERVRADGALFLIRPGHETVDVEDVVEETPAFHVVRKKDGGPAELAREHDPRSD